MSVSWLAQQEVFTAFCGLGFLATCVPAYWQFEAWNTGVVLWIVWCGIGCLAQFVDGIVWKDNFVDWAPAWCDIATRLLHVQPIGIAVASALINFRAYRLTKVGKMSTPVDSRRMKFLDVSIGLGVTTLFMITYWFIQERRYDIFEGLGCYPSTPYTIVWLFSYAIWPTIISMISVTFCTMTVTTYIQERKAPSSHEHVPSFMHPALTSLTPSRHLRLTLFGFATVVFLLPFHTTLVALALRFPLSATRPLDELHASIGLIRQTPRFVWIAERNVVSQAFVPPGSAVPLAFLFVAFFGLASETREGYVKMWRWISRGIKEAGKTNEKKGTTVATPFSLTFIQRVPTAHRPKRHQRTLSSSLSVCVTVEGLTVYDDVPTPTAGLPSRFGSSAISTSPTVYSSPRSPHSPSRSESLPSIYSTSRSLPGGLRSVGATRPTLCEVSPAESQAACVFAGSNPHSGRTSRTVPAFKFPPGLSPPAMRTPPAHPFYGPESAVCSSDSLV